MKKIILSLSAFLALILTTLPFTVHAVSLENPLSVDSLEGVLILVTRSLIGFIGVAGTFMFIYGGIMMLTAAGNVDQVKRSKEVLKWTASSIILILLSASIINFIFSTLNYNGGLAPTTSIGLNSGSLKDTILNATLVFLGLLGIIGTVMLVYGGYTWMTAAGNEQRLERAQSIIRAAAIGLIIVLISWSITRFIIETTSQATRTSTFVPSQHLDTRTLTKTNDFAILKEETYHQLTLKEVI